MGDGIAEARWMPSIPSWLLTDTQTFLLPRTFDHSVVEFNFQVSCWSNPVEGDSTQSGFPVEGDSAQAGCPLSFPSPGHLGSVIATAHHGLGMWGWVFPHIKILVFSVFLLAWRTSSWSGWKTGSADSLSSLTPALYNFCSSLRGFLLHN